MPDYHLFMNTVTGKNGKSVKKWYYWYYDISGKQVKKVCRKCRNKVEAESYINLLPPLQWDVLTVSDIARNMYLPGSDHWNRRKQFGKSVKEITMMECRHYIELIIETFGDETIQTLTVPKIQDYLFKVQRSGSWKNRYLDIFSEVYDEAVWKGVKVVKPEFTKFKRDTTPSSILSTDEINRLFIPDNFTSEMFSVFSLVSLSAGLRLGEARALRVSQFRNDFQALIVDGFMTQDGIRNPYNKTGSEEKPRFRVVLLPAVTTETVFSYIQKSNLKCDDYIFQYNNKPVRQEYAEKEFRRALKYAGINTDTRKITPHSLRFTYVTRTRRLIDSDTVMMMAGHSSIEMTEHYTRPELEENVRLLAPMKERINMFFE